MNNYDGIETEILKRKNAVRIQEQERRRRNKDSFNKALKFGIPAVFAIAIISVAVVLMVRSHDKPEETDFKGPNISIEKSEAVAEEPDIEEPFVPVVYSAHERPDTTGLPGDVVSSYGILIDLADDSILAARNSHTRICPASMTKILTLLVAVENLTEEQLDDKVTITLEFTDYSYANDLSAVGFAENEEVTVRDLLYGTILPSGGDAAIALATYVSGSEEAFVSLMNERLKTLELSDSTHFTNVAGMYDDNHYSTVYDMAMILHAAIDNELCRQVLNAHTYTTSNTEQHPEGITISNWFLRRIEDKDCGLKVQCAKTGFVVQSRNCAASYADDDTGHGYICVTADSTSSWRCIYDHVSIYSAFSGLKERPSVVSANESLSDNDIISDNDITSEADTGSDEDIASEDDTDPDTGSQSNESAPVSSGIKVDNTVLKNRGN